MSKWIEKMPFKLVHGVHLQVNVNSFEMHILDDPHPLSVTTTENLLTCVIFMKVSGTDLVR